MFMVTEFKISFTILLTTSAEILFLLAVHPGRHKNNIGIEEPQGYMSTVLNLLISITTNERGSILLQPRITCHEVPQHHNTLHHLDPDYSSTTSMSESLMFELTN